MEYGILISQIKIYYTFELNLIYICDEEVRMSIDSIETKNSKAVSLTIVSTGTDRIEFKLKVVRSTGKSYLTEPVPAYGLIAKSASETNSGLIAWDKEHKGRKFGIVHEWRIKHVEFEAVPEWREGSIGRPPKNKRAVKDVTAEYIAEKKELAEAAKVESLVETAEERALRKARMHERLSKLSGV